MSVIIRMPGQPQQKLSIHDYCIDFRANDTKMIFLLDHSKIKFDARLYFKKEAGLYFPCVVISCIGFFISALFYVCVLKFSERNTKKCLLGYTVTMGFSFLSLAAVQKFSGAACYYMGFCFLLCTICGFVWFMLLCFDLVVDLLYFENGYKSTKLWITYLLTSIGISVLVSLIIWTCKSRAFLNSFIRDNVQCNFQGSNDLLFFTLIATTLFFSLVSICFGFYIIHKYNRTHKDEFPWLEKRKKYKYTCISCILLWLPLTIWITIVGIDASGIKIQKLALDLIEGLQGIFVIIIFVSDRYTRKELKKKFRRKSRTRQEIESILRKDFGPESNKFAIRYTANHCDEHD